MGTSPNLTMLENLSLADNKCRPFDLSRGVTKPAGIITGSSFPCGPGWRIKWT